MDLSLFFAGTAGSAPTAKRGLPALLLRAGSQRILFDCGEGTQRQLLKSIGLPDVDAVFITHFHVDHWLGLLGLIKTLDLRGREKPLEVYGPGGLNALMTHLKPIIGRQGYPLTFTELEPHGEVPFDGWKIESFPVRHRIDAYGYAFVEEVRPGKFDPEAAIARGVDPGPKFRALQLGETVDGVGPEDVMGPPRAGRRIVISGDTAPCQTVELHAHDADLLVHEATFTDEEIARAKETAHTTARQAAELARDAGVKLLALVHLSTRYFPRDIRDEARAVFPNTVVPRDFDEIVVPFPEKGDPEIREATPEDEPAASWAESPPL